MRGSVRGMAGRSAKAHKTIFPGPARNDRAKRPSGLVCSAPSLGAPASGVHRSPQDPLERGSGKRTPGEGIGAGYRAYARPSPLPPGPQKVCTGRG